MHTLTPDIDNRQYTNRLIDTIDIDNTLKQIDQ